MGCAMISFRNHHINKNLRRLSNFNYQKFIEIWRLSLNMDFNNTDTVSYPADQVMLDGQPVNKGPETDSLYGS